MTDSEEERRRIAGRLRARRTALGWGCDDLARALGADPQEWALLEETGDLSALQLQRAARLLDLPPAALLDPAGPDPRVEEGFVAEATFRQIDRPEDRRLALTLLTLLAERRG